MRKKTVYIDMDGVLADYDKAAVGMSDDDKRQAGFFLNLEPIQDAIGAFNLLSSHYEAYIHSTAPWSNIHAPSEKRMWVEKHLGDKAFKRLILSHNKSLVKGEYLIDDRIANGVEGFEGEHIHFGSSKFPDWRSVLNYLNVA